tara:strand:+ start:27 stop:533 length:507 start_codon:yes stop_codon:yes gene_type:complete
MENILKTIVEKFGACEIKEKGVWMPLNKDYTNKQFDVKINGRVKFEKDLDFGNIGEVWADNLFNNGTIEVKTERDTGKPTQWVTTGNIAIEIRGRDGRLSGLSITQATIWVHLLSKNGHIKGGFVFEVSQLKKRIKELHSANPLRIVKGGDDDATQMILLPIDKLFKD